MAFSSTVTWNFYQYPPYPKSTILLFIPRSKGQLTDPSKIKSTNTKACTQKSSPKNTSSYSNNVWPNAYISHCIFRYLIQIFKKTFFITKYAGLLLIHLKNLCIRRISEEILCILPQSMLYKHKNVCAMSVF